jgi:hypothetical protein
MKRTLLGWLFRNSKDRCYRCGKKLTSIEKEYYTNTCEKCETKDAKEFIKY